MKWRVTSLNVQRSCSKTSAIFDAAMIAMRAGPSAYYQCSVLLLLLLSVQSRAEVVKSDDGNFRAAASIAHSQAARPPLPSVTADLFNT
jgi:hypothetical protein